MGDTAGVTGDVAPLHGALAAQDCVFPMKTAHRTHRRLLCASRVSAKTAACADGDDERMGRVVRWKRFVCAKHLPQTGNVLGLCLLLLHDVNVQEKRGPQPPSVRG